MDSERTNEMNSFWVTFRDHLPLCVDAETEEAARKLITHIGEILQVHILPYPALPRYNQLVGCPAFCYNPEKCAGRRSCPQRRACSE